jgi:hypothetical protein
MRVEDTGDLALGTHYDLTAEGLRVAGVEVEGEVPRLLAFSRELLESAEACLTVDRIEAGGIVRITTRNRGRLVYVLVGAADDNPDMLIGRWPD